MCGGTQSLHTNGYDEALALPTERAAKIALRTQQIIAHESGAADTVDPFAGSYYVESLTDEIERPRRRADRARSTSSAARSRRSRSSRTRSRSRPSATTSATGPSRTSSSASTSTSRRSAEVEDILRVDPEAERAQVERLKAFKAERDQELADQRLEELREAAARATRTCCRPSAPRSKDRCSIGEVCGAMRDVFGEYQPEM